MTRGRQKISFFFVFHGKTQITNNASQNRLAYRETVAEPAAPGWQCIDHV